MAKASRQVKTITINKSRDIIVDKLLKQCEDGAHAKCTGWAVLKKEISPIDANYFLKCNCSCHRQKGQSQAKKLKPKKKSVARKTKKKAIKKKAKRKQKLLKKSKKKGRKTRKR